jgi:hypothetical protein
MLVFRINLHSRGRLPLHFTRDGAKRIPFHTEGAWLPTLLTRIGLIKFGVTLSHVHHLFLNARARSRGFNAGLADERVDVRHTPFNDADLTARFTRHFLAAYSFGCGQVCILSVQTRGIGRDGARAATTIFGGCGSDARRVANTTIIARHRKISHRSISTALIIDIGRAGARTANIGTFGPRSVANGRVGFNVDKITTVGFRSDASRTANATIIVRHRTSSHREPALL